MARYRLVYEGPERFTVLDLEKPQKGHPKDTWVPNGLAVKTFTNLTEANQELIKLNGTKRKAKKQYRNPRRSSKNPRRMGKGNSREKP